MFEMTAMLQMSVISVVVKSDLLFGNIKQKSVQLRNLEVIPMVQN